MKNLPLLLANTISLLAILFINYFVGTGSFAEKTVGEVSSQYPTLITPAAYAFSIWGLIYLLLIAFVGYQWFSYYKRKDPYSVQRAGLWFTMANIANGCWVIAWVNEALGLSVIIMLLLLFSLVCLVKSLELEIWDAPLRIIAFVWWPICIYTGWIILATVTNVAVFLKSQGWVEGVLSPQIWAVIALVLASLLYLWLTYHRNMREAAIVGVWGLIAIAYKQWENDQAVALTALIAAAVLLIYTVFHALQHKETLPHKKLQWKE